MSWITCFRIGRRIVNNGVLLMIIGALHTSLAFSPDGFGYQFDKFYQHHFFRISGGMSQLPAVNGKLDFEASTAFWFFYFGLLLFPLGLLVHALEIKEQRLPMTFTLAYLLVVAVGCYMVPDSGMTYIMLPHALYMLATNAQESGK